jgi:hypothetical protein
LTTAAGADCVSEPGVDVHNDSRALLPRPRRDEFLNVPSIVVIELTILQAVVEEGSRFSCSSY